MFFPRPQHYWFAFVTAIVLFSSQVVIAADGDVPQSRRTFPAPREVQTTAEFKPHVGILTGFANTADDFGSAVNYGIDVGYQPVVPFGLGFELSRFTTSADLGGGLKEDLSRTKAIVRTTYNLGGTTPVIRSSYVGIGVGPVFDSRADSTYTKLGVNPLVGFDYPVDPRFTLGLSANYLIIPGTTPDTWGANGMVKYWF